MIFLNNLNNFDINIKNLEGKLDLYCLKNENLPLYFVSTCSNIARNAHYFQSRSKTGEPYQVHLEEVSNLGSFCVKDDYKLFTKKLLELHDWDEDVQKNNDVLSNLSLEQKDIIGIDKNLYHIHFSPLFTNFGVLGQFTAQTIRLFNKKVMLNYLFANNIIQTQDVNSLTDEEKEEKYLYYIKSLTGEYNYPTILNKQPELNKDLHSFFLSIGKISDIISNLDMGKPFNFNYQKNRLNLPDEQIEKNYYKYLKQKKRNCKRVLTCIPILYDNIQNNKFKKNLLIKKNLDLIIKSSNIFSNDYLDGKIDY